MGGVETYITRLSKELHAIGCDVSVVILSSKVDRLLLNELSAFAKVSICNSFSILNTSSWINAFMPIKKHTVDYDIVHVVDLLTLGFVYINQEAIRYKFLSIGIYHSLELSWWEEKNVYFRRKLIELHRKNIALTLFPSESIAYLASEQTGVPLNELSILPLGVDLSKYAYSHPSRSSKRIISVGRLVKFKTYNKHIIEQLKSIRELGDFQYYIYGDGPELLELQDLALLNQVDEYVHFMGEVDYSELPAVLNNVFCFVGSGTVLIEAAAAGIPSIVGIESIEEPITSGFFSEVVGYSYNEASASSIRVRILDKFKSLTVLSTDEYDEISSQHRKKAKQFNLKCTALQFVEFSNKTPDSSITINRWVAVLSLIVAVLMYGPRSLRMRFNVDPKSK